MQQVVQVSDAHRQRSRQQIEGVDLTTHRDEERARADAELGALGEEAFDLISPDSCHRINTASFDFLYSGAKVTLDVKTLRTPDADLWVRVRNGEKQMADAYVFLHYDDGAMRELGLLYKREVLSYGEYVEREDDHPAYRIDLNEYGHCLHEVELLWN